MMEHVSTDQHITEPRSAWRYLLSVVAAVLLFGIGLLFFGLFDVSSMTRRDHFGQIDLDGDKRWYMNIASLATQEMQDRDILYHGIGASVENLKKADVIILGHSVLEFGIDNEQVEAFEKKHGIKIFNLNNPGIASGAYVRELIKKWDLKPKIWLINADDTPSDFFASEMDDYFSSGRNSVFRIKEASYFTSYLNVASRGIRWRLEMLLVDYGPEWLTKPPYPFAKNFARTWRNIENGNFNADKANGYLFPGVALQKRREGGCPLSDDLIKKAGRYVADIGGSVVFTMLPYDGWCPERVPELAANLGLESFMPTDTSYELFDGRHMNKTGAIAYTTFMLGALEKTYAFKKMVGDANPGNPPAAPVSRLSLPIDVCVTNNSRDRLFVSARSERGNSDHAVEAGVTLRVAGLTDGQLCSSVDPFNADQCPNARYQVVDQCK